MDSEQGRLAEAHYYMRQQREVSNTRRALAALGAVFLCIAAALAVIFFVGMAMIGG